MNKNISSKKIFVVDKNNNKFQLFLDKILVAEAQYTIQKPDWLYNEEYLGLYKLGTKIQYRGKGYMQFLLKQIIDYTRNKFNINTILLNVYKSNVNALNLYKSLGFEIFKSFDDDEDEDPYFTLIIKLTNGNIT